MDSKRKTKESESIFDRQMKKDESSEKGHKRGKDKKEKHRKSKRRVNLPEAQFSQDSQQDLPQSRGLKSKAHYSYSTQKEQSQTKIHPSLSPPISRLLTCQLDISTRKTRFDFQVELVTEQSLSPVTASQLFGPQFSRLTIKKDKDQTQIIQYLAQTNKKYQFMVCWAQPTQTNNLLLLSEIANEANEKRRIFGWQSDQIKMHIMSIRQFSEIGRFAIPEGVALPGAANSLSQERVVMIVQYPQKLFEIRDLYKGTQAQPCLTLSSEHQEVTKEDAKEQPIKQIEPFISAQPAKPCYYEQKIVYEGWGNEESVIDQPPQESSSQCNQQTPLATNAPLDKITQIRLHFGFGEFDPILTDQQDEKEEKCKDLAGQLLNSLGNIRIPLPFGQQQPLFQNPIQRCYAGYAYQPLQFYQQDNNWMMYRNQNMPQNSNQVYHLDNMTGSYGPQYPGVQTQQTTNRPVGGYSAPLNQQYHHNPQAAKGGYPPQYPRTYQQ